MRSLLPITAPRVGMWGKAGLFLKHRVAAEVRLGVTSRAGGVRRETEHTGSVLGYLPVGPSWSTCPVTEHNLRSLRASFSAPRCGCAVSAQGRAQKGSPFTGLRTQRISPSFTRGETEARRGRGRPELAGALQAAWFPLFSPMLLGPLKI